MRPLRQISLISPSAEPKCRKTAREGRNLAAARRGDDKSLSRTRARTYEGIMVSDMLKGTAMSYGSLEDEALAEIFAVLALEAGAAIMRVFDSNPQIRVKSDSSPVCDADLFGEEIILNGLSRHAPFPVVAEELCAAGKIPALDGGDFILVDALDGTKEFMARQPYFTVNIALI